MTNVIKFTHRRRALEEAREQACVWLVKLDVGASEEDIEDIRAWLEKSKDHADILMKAAAVWDQASILSELSDLFPLEQYSRTSSRLAGVRRPLRYLSALFVAVILAGGGLYGWTSFERQGLRQEGFYNSYETMIGKRSNLTLPDGSEIILNTNTLVEVFYTADVRDVHLRRGEGHFTVSKDVNRPFRVHAGNNVIEAVGTAFAVQHIQEESIEVTVTEGVVHFSRTTEIPSIPVAETQNDMTDDEDVIPRPASPPLSLALSAGESVSLRDRDQPLEKRKIEPIEMEGRLAWRHGMLLFQRSPLEQVIKEVSRYTAIKIEMDESVKGIEVEGYFQTGDIDGLILSMSETFNIKVEKINQDHIYLSSN